MKPAKSVSDKIKAVLEAQGIEALIDFGMDPAPNYGVDSITALSINGEPQVVLHKPHDPDLLTSAKAIQAALKHLKPVQPLFPPKKLTSYWDKKVNEQVTFQEPHLQVKPLPGFDPMAFALHNPSDFMMDMGTPEQASDVPQKLHMLKSKTPVADQFKIVFNPTFKLHPGALKSVTNPVVPEPPPYVPSLAHYEAMLKGAVHFHGVTSVPMVDKFGALDKQKALQFLKSAPGYYSVHPMMHGGLAMFAVHESGLAFNCQNFYTPEGIKKLVLTSMDNGYHFHMLGTGDIIIEADQMSIMPGGHKFDYKPAFTTNLEPQAKISFYAFKADFLLELGEVPKQRQFVRTSGDTSDYFVMNAGSIDLWRVTGDGEWVVANHELQSLILDLYEGRWLEAHL